MPKFGQAWFAGELYGDKKLTPCSYRNSIHRVRLGIQVHKLLRISNWRGVKDTSKAIIFQTRRGNGYYSSVLGKLYQQKIKYKVPWPNGNNKCAASQHTYATAVSNWKNVLTEEQKTEYNRRAVRRMHMSGYNLYIKEYINTMSPVFKFWTQFSWTKFGTTAKFGGP